MDWFTFYIGLSKAGVFDLLLFVFFSYGITNIFLFGIIFDPIRDWIKSWNVKKINQFIQCPMCIGFWSGIIVNLTILPLSNVWGDAILGSVFSYLLVKIEDIILILERLSTW